MSGVHFQQRADVDLLQIGGDLGIYTVAQVRQTLLAVLSAQTGRPIELDTQSVDEADSAGVQLLVATARFVREGGGRALCGATGEAVASVARRLGAVGPGTFCGWECPQQEDHHA